MATTTLERPESKTAGESSKPDVVRYDPWATWPGTTLRRLGGEMDRFFEDFGFGHPWLAPLWRGGTAENLWAPQIEMLEKNGQFIVRADLPGLKKDDVKVEVTDDGLSIRGERKQESEEKKGGYYRSERCYGSFFRMVPLPEGVLADKISATFRDGVLEVTMPAPPKAAQTGRRIDVKE
ncbi:MAG TPA: Hsp20/alpha crystallin family protein [Vicinamibacterales bacterium]|nr:Hsp20/alpha crystallin family protein [Vicinamibacterales bacterium]